ncbi:uncharacterized protein PRCAT00005207001 [Priceomyces carsonii]|uniref:uncharacterized protein n=1 Tax=Priceomyces carsonii TaxID=28549 RepID=UPI002ED8B2E1|nr:unnamed protein product [Priceomyces carsonii]
MIHNAKSSNSLNRQRVQQRDRSSTLTSLESFNISSIDRERHVLDRHSLLAAESPTYLSSEILSGLSNEKDAYFILSKGNELISLVNLHPNLRNDLMIKSLIHKIQFMFHHEVLEVRALSYKILRCVVSNYESLTILVQSKILIYIIITMSTSQPNLLEKIQSLKLIRQFISIPRGADMVSIGVIKAIISLIESDDHLFTPNFKNYCIETICEITLYKPELIFHSGGFNTLIDTIINGSFDISLCCLLVLINILDKKDSRKFLRNGYDLNSMISDFDGFNDNTRKIPLLKLQKISFLISILLKTYNGLMAFSINNFEILRSFLLTLKNKNDQTRHLVLDVLFDILRIKLISWLESGSFGSYIKHFKSKVGRGSPVFKYLELNKQSIEYNLIQHYRGLLTMILINNNIIPILVELIEEDSDESITEKATALLSNILKLTSDLLPREYLHNKVLLPSSIKNKPIISSIFKIESLIRTSNGRNEVLELKSNNELKSYIKELNIKSRYDLDDNAFKILINSTKVLALKEFENWNWSLISDFIQGPLMNPKRFDELTEKNPKFLKRLLSFYRPFKFRFCKISSSLSRRDDSHNKYIDTGCQLLEALLSFDKGIKYLSMNKLLPQLSEIFAQIDPFSGISAKDPILSKKRLESTLSIGYLKLVGVLSSNLYGLKMLEQWQFFNIFQDIIEYSISKSSNNYLICELFKNLDFAFDSELRIILAKSMSVSNVKIKSFLMSSVLPKLIQQKETELFTIKLLANLLYDINYQTLDKSIDLLNTYYMSNDLNNLDYFISLRPPVHILSKSVKGKFLLMNCLKTSNGFKYLEETGFIDNECEYWFNSKNLTHLDVIENLIQTNFFPYNPTSSIVGTYQDDNSIKFFNYLLSTEDGLNFFSNLKQKNYLDKIINEIDICARYLNSKDDIEIEDSDSEIHYGEQNATMKAQNQTQSFGRFKFNLKFLKQQLWIIGIISSSEYGIQLLDPIYNTSLDKSIIKIVLELFYECSIWQIRNICFYVIGMIASTTEGVEILDELNWISVIDEFSNPKCLAYPKSSSTNDLFNVEYINPYRNIKYYSIFNGTDNEYGGDLFNDIDETSIVTFEKINEKVLVLVKYLTSVLGRIERKATKELLKIKKSNPEVFESQALFLEVIRLIDRGNFKFENRKFILDLFLNETRVLENLSRKERKR